MMFILNTLVQVAAFAAGIYIAFTDSFWAGASLVAIVLVLHGLVSGLSNLLMWLHQKTMSQDQLESIYQRAQAAEMFGDGQMMTEATPALWRVISFSCGLLFLGLSASVIYAFLTGFLP